MVPAPFICELLAPSAGGSRKQAFPSNLEKAVRVNIASVCAVLDSEEERPWQWHIKTLHASNVLLPLLQPGRENSAFLGLM